jgi:hypothetical protein
MPVDNLPIRLPVRQALISKGIMTLQDIKTKLSNPELKRIPLLNKAELQLIQNFIAAADALAMED